jgi:hypothetical protein
MDNWDSEGYLARTPYKEPDMPVVKLPVPDVSDIIFQYGEGGLPKKATLYRIQGDPRRGVWIAQILDASPGTIQTTRADMFALYAEVLYKEVIKRGFRIPIDSGKPLPPKEAAGYTSVFTQNNAIFIALGPAAGLPVDIEIPTWTWRG